MSIFQRLVFSTETVFWNQIKKKKVIYSELALRKCKDLKNQQGQICSHLGNDYSMHRCVQVRFNQASLGTSRRTTAAAAAFSLSCTSLFGTMDVFSGSWPEPKSMLTWLHCH